MFLQNVSFRSRDNNFYGTDYKTGENLKFLTQVYHAYFRLNRPNSIERFFGLLEHENNLKTLFLSYVFDFKGFLEENFPIMKKQWNLSEYIHNLLSLLNAAESKTLKPDIFVYFCKKLLIFSELASSTKIFSKNI